jgi:hypothetical protein
MGGREIGVDRVIQSHRFIVGPISTQRRDPGDILRVIFDVTGFAVNAVGCIDL